MKKLPRTPKSVLLARAVGAGASPRPRSVAPQQLDITRVESDFDSIRRLLAGRGLLDRFGAPSQISVQVHKGVSEPVWEMGASSPVVYVQAEPPGLSIWVDGFEVCRVPTSEIEEFGIGDAVRKSLDSVYPIAPLGCISCGGPRGDSDGETCATCLAAQISDLKAIAAELITGTN